MAPFSKTPSHSGDKKSVTRAVPPGHAIISNSYEELTPKHPARVATKIRPTKKPQREGYR
jgi:hypothetical protein